jgi:hypothetical protein
VANYNTLAKQIAADLNAKWGVTWVTPLLIQIFIVISLPVRTKIYQFLIVQEAWLKVLIAEAVIKSQKWDYIAIQIEALRTALATVSAPINALLNVIPVDTIINAVPQVQSFLGNTNQVTNNATSTSSFNSTTDSLSKVSPAFSSFLQTLTQSIPVKIPAAAISDVLGSGFDFFDGISSLKDLQNKLDDLIFRSARATAVSTYVGAGGSYLSNLLTQIQVYADLLLTLDSNNV